MSATDVWGAVWVSERLNGEIGLYKIGELTPSSTLQLPLGKLGALRTFTASPDLRWLAMSTRTRGGVWDTEKNERALLIRGFQNAYYAPNSVFFMEFPEFEKDSRAMVVVSPVTKQIKDRQIDKDDDVTFFGSEFLRTRHNDDNRTALRNFQLDVLDMATAKPLWSRNFPKQGPRVSGSPSADKMIFVWNARADGLREELARDGKIQASWNKQNPGDTDYFLEFWTPAREPWLAEPLCAPENTLFCPKINRPQQIGLSSPTIAIAFFFIPFRRVSKERNGSVIGRRSLPMVTGYAWQTGEGIWLSTIFTR